MDGDDRVAVVEECRQFVNLFNDSAMENQENYQNFAEVYDRMMDTGYKTPEILSRMCMEQLNNNSSQIALLDIASGTGRLAHALRTLGYKGIIDGIEASSKMIEECIKKNNIYREVKEHFLSEDQPMPYSDDTYDIVICAGALCMGHIPYQCIRDMIRVLKPGGIFLFNVSRLVFDKNNVAIPAIQEFMNQMMSENRCKLVQESSELAYENPLYKMAEKSFFYCYQAI